MTKREQKLFSVNNLIGVPAIDMTIKINMGSIKKKRRSVSKEPIKEKYSYNKSKPDIRCKHNDVKKIGVGVFRCLDCGYEYFLG